MVQLGAEAYEQIAKEEKESTDPVLSEKVRTIAGQVAAAASTQMEWEFKIFQSDQVNAFCLPGGKIGIYTGILPVAQTNAGLAAIIGHEIAHATLRHGNERMSQGLLVQLGLQASDLALQNNEYRTPILAALGAGAQVGVVLPFSRYQEQEADEIGLKYMLKAGFNGEEAAAVWNRMAALKATHNGGKVPAWLSTHPDSTERERNLAKRAREWGHLRGTPIETNTL
jgi:predicted Zn-dependent protease